VRAAGNIFAPSGGPGKTGKMTVKLLKRELTRIKNE